MIEQPNLFEVESSANEIERILLYALGEFQSRGKILADRELALDRLRGAFKRAAEKFGTAEFSDEEIAKNLEKLDAKIIRVPNFVAKHPFRITIYQSLARRAFEFFKAESEKEKEK
ncbi:MAG TPA: hypothetical protein VNI60_01465 [Pyrinomonadaceae bacterium]|nr:hypothetical protein [Pyrinomonadaceae bacterium]